MKQCPSCQRRFVPQEDVCPLDGARLVASQPGTAPPGVGRQLGAYQLISLLGEGGMGNIYIGRHAQLGRHVAIKVLRPELANKKDNIARFFQEAHTINRLKHPNIVESLDLVEDVVDGAYCVLELLKGPDLKTRLSRGPVSIESAIHIATQLADALGKVHAIGVVHRDLKPENLILIERDGRDDFVKLIDFGIAQIGDQGAGFIGTAAYMAPEQAVKGATVDRRADIYSLGVLMFEMVTGRHPFPSSTDGEFLIHHEGTRPPRPSKLNPKCPPALEALILKCMEKRPDARYAAADQVAAALRLIDPHTRSGGRAGWLVAGLLVAGGAAAAAYVLVPTYLTRRSDETAAVARGETPEEAGSAPAAPAAPAAPITPPAPTPPPAAPVEPTGSAGSGSEGSAAAPEVATRDARPSLVEIGIVSTPEGATVYRANETVALGVTPFTVPLPRSDKPTEMRFEKAGYQPKTIEVPLEDDLEIEVSLARQRDPVASKAGVKFKKSSASTGEKPAVKKGVQREGVIDPFATP